MDTNKSPNGVGKKKHTSTRNSSAPTTFGLLKLSSIVKNIQY